MPEQALYLAWRPMRFEDVIGQEHITRTLRNALKTGRLRHAYLFSGPRGTGKTTTARLLAKAVNCAQEDPRERPCNHCDPCRRVNEGRYLDLIEIDAATHTGVDDVRDLRDRVAFAPGEGRYKVYIIDEVHRFTGNAFDALLKTLEEPPPHAVFVLATTEIDKVPATIKSRCLPFEFRRVALLTVADHLQKIADAEGLNVERQALELIARQGTGSVRDSISLLDQIVTDPAEPVTLALARDVLGTASSDAVRSLVDALVQEDLAAGLEIINHAIDAGSDPQQFGHQVVEQLRALLLAQTNAVDLVVATDEEREQYQAQAGQIPPDRTLRALRKFNEALADDLGAWQPQLALELALVESLAAPPAVSAAPALPREPATPALAQRRQPAAVPAAPVAAPAAAPAAGTDAPPAPSGELALEQVQARWQEVLQTLQREHGRSNLPALAQHATPAALREDQLTISAASGLFREKLDKPDTRATLEQTLRALFGRPLRVRVQLQKSDASDAPHINREDPVIARAMALGARVSIHQDGEGEV